MEDREMMRIARRRAGMKLGFFIHLGVFVAVNLMLFTVNQQVTPQHTWFPFPLGGWAIGLTMHGLAVYFSLSGVRERMIEEELRKLGKRTETSVR